MISLNDADPAAAAGSLCEDANNDPSTLGSGVSAGVPYEGDFDMIRTDILSWSSDVSSCVSAPVAQAQSRKINADRDLVYKIA